MIKMTLKIPIEVKIYHDHPEVWHIAGETINYTGEGRTRVQAVDYFKRGLLATIEARLPVPKKHNGKNKK